MGPRSIPPETPEEKVVYWTIVGTWGFWLLGSLYIVGSLIGYVLIAMIALRILSLDEARISGLSMPPATVWVWVAGMLLMALALIIGHYDYELGLPLTVKSFAGWAKGWALFAIFPLIGAVMAIRPIVVVRALSWLSLQTLMIAPILWLASIVNFPAIIYVSPLHVIASGPEFFDVTLYVLDDVTGKIRFRFYSPWATAAAFLASIGFIIALYERSLRLKLVGMLAAVVVFMMSGSRLSAVALPVVLVAIVVLSNLLQPRMWVTFAISATVVVLLSQEVGAALQNAVETFNAARADSSRVRKALGEIAYYRWHTEAFWFGHGVLERGGHVVERMMIGSHHTWWGLLFVKGAVGFAALGIPMAITAIALAARAQTDRVARAGLGIVIAMMLFSLADNLEIIAYQMWPGLLLIGTALKRPLANPMLRRLSGRNAA